MTKALYTMNGREHEVIPSIELDNI